MSMFVSDILLFDRRLNLYVLLLLLIDSQTFEEIYLTRVSRPKQLTT